MLVKYIKLGDMIDDPRVKHITKYDFPNIARYGELLANEIRRNDTLLIDFWEELKGRLTVGTVVDFRTKTGVHIVSYANTYEDFLKVLEFTKTLPRPGYRTVSSINFYTYVGNTIEEMLAYRDRIVLALCRADRTVVYPDTNPTPLFPIIKDIYAHNIRTSESL